MGVINYLLGPGMFFTPFVYIALHLIVERRFSGHAPVRLGLRIVTVLGGIALIVCALTSPPEIMVLMPSRGTSKNEIPASYFLVIAGVVLATLPLYSRHIKFSNPEK